MRPNLNIYLLSFIHKMLFHTFIIYCDKICENRFNDNTIHHFSFKSKKYRDKLRTEVKTLENLLPIDRPALHRKLDSQTVYRLVIAFLRIKALFKGEFKRFSS